MKKVLLTVLLLLSVFGLFACSSGEISPDDKSSDKPIITDPPVITASLPHMEYPCGYVFGFDRELIVSAKDNQGNEIDYIVKTFTHVDTGFDFDTEVKTQVLNAMGDYNIVLSATDGAGRKTEKTLKFSVVQDTEAPKIEVGDEVLVAPQSSVDLNGLPVTDNSGNIPEKTFTVTYFDGTEREVSDGVLTVNNGGFYNVTETATDYSGNVGTKSFRLMIEGTYFNDLDDVIIDGEALENFWVSDSSLGGTTPRSKTVVDGNAVIKFDMRADEKITFNIPLNGASLTEDDEYFAYLGIFTDKDITSGGIVFTSGGDLSNVSGGLNSENKSAVFKGDFIVPSAKRLATFYFENTTGENISVYFDYIMLIVKPVWAERRTQVFGGSKDVDDQGNFKTVFAKADNAVNFYLAKDETAFANEKVTVTMKYKVKSDNGWCMGAHGATISHGNGTEYNLENAPQDGDGWLTYEFVAIVSCRVGAHASNVVYYGTDKPHIALVFLFQNEAELVIKEMTVTPVTDWAERRTQVFGGSKEVDDQGNFKIVFAKADNAVNFYLAEGETAFANEKVTVTMKYKVKSDNGWCMGAHGATISHGNGTEFNLENAPQDGDGWLTYEFDAIVSCRVGAHASNVVYYGTDKPHIALVFLFQNEAELVIKEMTVTPKTAVKTVAVTTINPKETGDDYATYITDMKEHVIDLGLNGNTLYMLPSVTGMQCLSAIITNEDGDVFVIDGGFNNDYQTIYHYVTELGKDTIKGWFFTHPHQDHFNVFSKFIAKYGEEITVEKVYYSWSEEESWYTARKSFEHGDIMLDGFNAFKNAVTTCGCTHIEPMTGDIYNFGSFSFEIMYSPKNGDGTYGFDLAKYGFDPTDESKGRYNVNDLSLVIKMTAGDKTLLFLGDAGAEAGKWLYDTYQGTDELEADFVQMAHHGQGGVEENVYGLIQPHYAFFNCDYAVWNNTSGKLKTLEVRGWIDALGATAYCSQLGANNVAGDSIVYIFK